MTKILFYLVCIVIYLLIAKPLEIIHKLKRKKDEKVHRTISKRNQCAD